VFCGYVTNTTVYRKVTDALEVTGKYLLDLSLFWEVLSCSLAEIDRFFYIFVLKQRHFLHSPLICYHCEVSIYVRLHVSTDTQASSGLLYGFTL
jgi:uncharacterized protein YozE (UPF0346 family)